MPARCQRSQPAAAATECSWYDAPTMTARWVQTWQRLLVLGNYLSLMLMLLAIDIGGKLGWNVPLIVAASVLGAILVLTFWRVHVRTGCLRLIYSRSDRLSEADLRLTRSALALGLLWFVALLLLGIYFKVFITYNRLSVLDLAAFVYLAATLPSAALAWRGPDPLSPRAAVLAVVRRVLLALVLIAALLALNLTVIRPWQHHWGATRAEVARAMPGDELVADPDMNATRVVTVNATPAEVWPWIRQIGYQRAGFYSLDALDNEGDVSSRSILPEFQHIEVGDQIAVGKGAWMQVVELEPERFLVLQFGEGPWAGNSWTFGLYPQGDGRTRLVSRLRARYHKEFPHIIPWLIIDTFEIIMMRGCLLGIRERAEAGSA